MGKVFTKGSSKICGRQPLKNLIGYGLLAKQNNLSQTQLKILRHGLPGSSSWWLNLGLSC